MQSTMRIFVTIFLFTSVIASKYHSSTKLRRDGVLNLYPFPRVGRAYSNAWRMPIKDSYFDYECLEKRHLVPFPRIGRNAFPITSADPSPDFAPMPVRRGDTQGLWFGPRLGRSFKSDEGDITQSEVSEHGDPELMEAVPGDR